MRINWLVRFKNKEFWMALIPAVFVFIQMVAAIFGFEFDFTELSMKILAAVDALFLILTIIGIVTDPTTKGLGDSIQALQYTKPKDDSHFKFEGTD